MHREVRSWYTASAPEIGLSIIAEAYGFLTDWDWSGRKRLVLTVESPDRVAPALAEAADFYGTPEFEVWVEGRSRADRLTAALSSVGMMPAHATVTLALVGPVGADPGPDGLAVEEVVDEEQLKEWATTKIQGFADDDALPPPSGSKASSPAEGRSGRSAAISWRAARGRCRRHPRALHGSGPDGVQPGHQAPVPPPRHRPVDARPLECRSRARAGPVPADQLRRRRRARGPLPPAGLHRRGVLVPTVPPRH